MKCTFETGHGQHHRQARSEFETGQVTGIPKVVAGPLANSGVADVVDQERTCAVQSFQHDLSAFGGVRARVPKVGLDRNVRLRQVVVHEVIRQVVEVTGLIRVVGHE